MAEDFRDGSHVDASLQHPRGSRMTQVMESDLDACG